MTIPTNPATLLVTFIGLFILLLSGPSWANISNDKVVLQLKWLHQFQFAGYYAAQQQGFYSDEGLDVEIRERDPAVAPSEEVLSGKAQFGIADTSLILQRLRGEPLVIMAAIFQHSPLVLITLKDSGIISPLELKGKRVMYQQNVDDAVLTAMLTEFEMDSTSFEHVAHSFKDDALLTSNIDAMSVYLTNQPFFYKNNNTDINIISPVSYGIDFYGDMLFTSENYMNNHTDSALAFRRASIKGWEYALANPEQVVDWIIDRYGSDKPREQLLFEASMTRRMIQPELVALGHINDNRFGSIVNTYRQLGMTAEQTDIKGINYQDYIHEHSNNESRWLPIIQIALFLSIVLMLVIFAINKRLKTLVKIRTQELEDSRKELEKLSNTDSLTGLSNRRCLDEFLKLKLSEVARYQTPLSVIILDIDHFKRVNDSLGHNIGDQILKALATLMSENVRSTDMLGRWGGEEFMIISPQTQLEGAARLAELLRTAIEKHDFSIDLPICCSFGVAQLESGETPKELFSRADKALYKAKQTGRNKVVTATPSSSKQSETTNPTGA